MDEASKEPGAPTIQERRRSLHQRLADSFVPSLPTDSDFARRSAGTYRGRRYAPTSSIAWNETLQHVEHATRASVRCAFVEAHDDFNMYTQIRQGVERVFQPLRAGVGDALRSMRELGRFSVRDIATKFDERV